MYHWLHLFVCELNVDGQIVHACVPKSLGNMSQLLNAARLLLLCQMWFIDCSARLLVILHGALQANDGPIDANAWLLFFFLLSFSAAVEDSEPKAEWDQCRLGLVFMRDGEHLWLICVLGNHLGRVVDRNAIVPRSRSVKGLATAAKKVENKALKLKRNDRKLPFARWEGGQRPINAKLAVTKLSAHKIELKRPF